MNFKTKEPPTQTMRQHSNCTAETNKTAFEIVCFKRLKHPFSCLLILPLHRLLIQDYLILFKKHFSFTGFFPVNLYASIKTLKIKLMQYIKENTDADSDESYFIAFCTP